MAIEIENSQEFGKDGTAISDENGEIIYWEGAASGPPSFQAPIGSNYTDTDNGKRYVKVGALATDWLAFSTAIFQGITPPMMLTHNGNLADGQLVGVNNLVNNPVVIGFRCKLVKVSYYNTRSNSDADFRYYKGNENPSNLFYTISFSNQTTFVETITGSPIFEVGDLLKIYYDDQGQNPRDMTMGLFLEAVPV